MKVEKNILADLPEVYVVEALMMDCRASVLAASEGRAGGFLFQAPDWRPQQLWEGPGGCMSVVPLPGQTERLLAIQGFFPVFDAAGASLVMFTKPRDTASGWIMETLVSLPYLHRCCVLDNGREYYILASTVCGGKAFRDDWSSPGALYISPWDPVDPANVDFYPLLEGLPKNHGLTTTQFNGRQTVLVSSGAGLLAGVPSTLSPREWVWEEWLPQEVSDTVVADIDGDGCEEVITIEPFHGDHLIVYDRTGEALRPVKHRPLNFGHALWAGPVLGRESIIAGSRDGDGSLKIYFEDADPVLLDLEIGATQAVAFPCMDMCCIVSANHAQGQVAMYTCRESSS